MSIKSIVKKITLITAVIILICGAAFPLAGCEKPPVSIYVVTMFGGGDAHSEFFQQINKEYTTETGVEILNNSSKASSLWQINVRSSFTADILTPDVLFYFNDTAADSIRDRLIKVDDIREYDSGYGKDITVNISDKACLPFKGFSEGIIYNTDLYSAQDFVSYQKLKEKIITLQNDEKTRVSAGNDVPHYWLNYLLVLELGVEEFNSFDGTQTFFNTQQRKDKWINAIDWAVKEMQDMGIGTDGTKLEANESARFFTGERGLLIDGSWVAGKVMSSPKYDKLEIAGFPKKDAGSPAFNLNGFTSGWYITDKAWNNEETRRAAVDYVKKQTSAETIERYCQKTGGIPATGKNVQGATTAANKFGTLVSGSVAVTPLDDRILDKAKSNLYSQSAGVGAMLAGVENISAEKVFNSVFKELKN